MINFKKYKIIRIINSRLRGRKYTGDFHRERYKVCKNCEFNSLHNSKNTLKYKFWSLMNFKKVFCTICGCDIFLKTSEELEECSYNPPKWKKII